MKDRSVLELGTLIIMVARPTVKRFTYILLYFSECVLFIIFLVTQ